MIECDTAIGDLEEDSVGNEIAVRSRSSGNCQEHESKHNQQGAGKLNVAKMVRRRNAEHFKYRASAEKECQTQHSVVQGRDIEQPCNC